MTATAHDIIEDLRGRIRDIEGRRTTSSSFISTGWEPIDRILPGGGFPRGALSELSGGRASGKTAIALATLASATRERGVAAFVDGRHELYPPAAAALGLDLDRLLLVRPDRGDPVQAARVGLWAAEALLGSGAFEVVAIDVALEGTAAASMGAASLELMFRRLRTAAEKGGAAGLWIAGPGAIRCPSAVHVDCSRVAAGWHVRRAHARGVAGEGAEPAATAIAPVHHAA